MISQQILDLLHEVRRTDINVGSRLNPILAVKTSEYFLTYSCELLQVKTTLTASRCCSRSRSQRLLFICDLEGTLKTTKYLAKIYFNYYLDAIQRKGNKFPVKRLYLLIYSAIRIAIKFNQNAQFSDKFSIWFCIKQCKMQFTESDFVNFEIELISSLNYRLKLSTPYDFFPIRELLPTMRIDHFRNAYMILDLAISMPEMSCLSGQQLFWSCLLVSARKTLDDFTYSIVVAVINDQERLEFVLQASATIAELQVQLAGGN